MEQLKNNQFATAGAMAGIATLVWQYLRGIPSYWWNRIYRMFHFHVIVEQGDILHHYITLVMYNTYSKDIKSAEARTAPDGSIILSQREDFIYKWIKGRRIKITASREKIEGALNAENMFNRSFSFSGLFAKKVITELLEDFRTKGILINEELLRSKRHISFVVCSPFDVPEPMYRLFPKKFDKIYIPKESKEALINDLAKFRDSRQAYLDRNIAYRRGYCFSGPPGNGKSSLIGAMADFLQYDITELDLKNSSERFRRIVNRIPTKCIVTIEDFDSYYIGREAQNEDVIPFSVLLNFISGVAAREDIILVITTNAPESLDPAMLRGGRLDFKLTIPNPTKELVEEYLSDEFDQPVILPSLKPICFADVQDVVMMQNDLESVVKELIIPTEDV